MHMYLLLHRAQNCLCSSTWIVTQYSEYMSRHAPNPSRSLDVQAQHAVKVVQEVVKLAEADRKVSDLEEQRKYGDPAQLKASAPSLAAILKNDPTPQLSLKTCVDLLIFYVANWDWSS